MANLAFNLKPQVIAPSSLITILWLLYTKIIWIRLIVFSYTFEIYTFTWKNTGLKHFQQKKDFNQSVFNFALPDGDCPEQHCGWGGWFSTFGWSDRCRLQTWSQEGRQKKNHNEQAKGTSGKTLIFFWSFGFWACQMYIPED